jgi:hypothetical protein
MEVRKEGKVAADTLAHTAMGLKIGGIACSTGLLRLCGAT